jgi:hypothetical protein
LFSVAFKLIARSKKNPPPTHVWQRVPEGLVVTFATLREAESQPPTRCLDANDGWHDGANGGDVAF